jgi:Suppressor of fused protein (SUFU)
MSDELFLKYQAFFGRPADLVLKSRADAVPAISVGRFPAVSAGFLRRFVTPVHDRFVYITHGMSLTPMRVPPDQTRIYPSRIELIAYCAQPYVGADDGTDMVALHLQALATMPFQTDMFFGPMHTAALEEPICPNSTMSAFFFALPDGVKMSRLCSCTPAAQLVVSVMPITSSERAYAVGNGADRLVDLLDSGGVPNFFDPFRQPVA